MNKQWRLSLVIAGGMLSAISVLHAQDGNSKSTSKRYASEQRIPVSKEPLPPVDVKGSITNVTVDGTNQVITMPAPIRAFRLEDYANLTEPQLAYYFATRDSLLIAIHRIANNKVVDPTVRNFAATQEQERTKHLARTLHVISDDLKGVVEPIPNDYDQERLRQLVMHFDTLSSGPAFDAAYMKAMYLTYENQANVLKINEKNAHEEDFEDLVDDGIKGFSTVRDQAWAIMTALGITLP